MSLDINTAFLNAPLQRDVCVKQSVRFEKPGKVKTRFALTECSVVFEVVLKTLAWDLS